MKTIHYVTAALLIVGGLNWGLVALAQFDLVATVTGQQFGQTNFLSRIVYALVGIAAAIEAIGLVARTRHQHHPVTAG